jgi:hypothetical protein
LSTTARGISFRGRAESVENTFRRRHRHYRLSQREHEKRALDGGAIGFPGKPFNEETLVRADYLLPDLRDCSAVKSLRPGQPADQTTHLRKSRGNARQAVLAARNTRTLSSRTVVVLNWRKFAAPTKPNGAHPLFIWRHRCAPDSRPAAPGWPWDSSTALPSGGRAHAAHRSRGTLPRLQD